MGRSVFVLFIIGLSLLLVGFTGKNQQVNISKTSPSISPSNTPSGTLQPTQVLGTQEESYPVVKVIDGDTVDIEINGAKDTVRLIGIDTPETVDPRKPVQCFGNEASEKAKELLEDQSVSLEADLTQGERDKYGRLLRYIFLADGTNFNKLMISEGYAHEYTYNTPYKYQLEFKQAEKEARENKNGLWADNACITTPAQTQAQSQIKPTEQPSNTGGYACDCSKTCTQISSCGEAYFQLNICGCKVRDSDSDGVPCESLCR